ncbi:4d30a0e5-42d4-4a09-afc6-e2612d422c12 [Thermothielavioides terrestris]|uniref:4d30a0e5-42d4-4a09-afc6-e2612d422c12 n=1 Tax=Thermothielavioides terrestris TaxID=2587410 RepID=A0A446BYV9_9PEZI|nr:4d30a0e5-42d4-4a09-afc6-e2612d422c12 [Thermothielavioides terrestris]
MPSFGGMQQAVGQQRPAAAAGLTVQLEDLPVETTIEILSHLDFETLDKMLLVSRRLNRIIESHFATILSAVVERDFSPAEGFLAVLREVILPGSGVHSVDSGILNGSSQLKLPSSASGFYAVMNFCRAVKRWETEFPSLRFCYLPQHSRILEPHELYRLRSALYAWWRFAHAFHGPAPCPPGLDNSPEGRRSFIRQFSTAQLHELYDLWSTIDAAVGTRVCPSTSAVIAMGNPGAPWKMMTMEEAARIGWGTYAVHIEIVQTMVKLRPEDILHLLVYRHRYATKASVIQFVRLRHPRIEEGPQTLTAAILDVVEERQSSPFPPFPFKLSFPLNHGGILDHKTPELEALRDVYNTDAGSGIHDYPQWLQDRDLSRTVGGGRLDSNS